MQSAETKRNFRTREPDLDNASVGRTLIEKAILKLGSIGSRLFF